MKAGMIALAAGSVALVSVATGVKANEKNWTPPKSEIVAQKIADDTMAAHPELLSMTLHGVPPGMSKVYTMFAGSYHDRIGNADDPDDIDVITKGITIIDPRWHRTKDTSKKFVVQMPLRDAAGDNVGLVVYAFKNNTPPSNPELDYFEKAQALSMALSKQVPSYDGLFAPAK